MSRGTTPPSSCDAAGAGAPPILFCPHTEPPTRVVNVINAVDDVGGKLMLLNAPTLQDRVTVFRAVVAYATALLESSESDNHIGAVQVCRALFSSAKITARVSQRIVTSAFVESLLPLILDVLCTASSQLLWATYGLIVCSCTAATTTRSVVSPDVLAEHLHSYFVENMTPLAQQRAEEMGVVAVERLLAVASAVIATRDAESSSLLGADPWYRTAQDVAMQLPEVSSTRVFAGFLASLRLSYPLVPVPARLQQLSPPSNLAATATRKEPTQSSEREAVAAYFRSAAGVPNVAADGRESATPTPDERGDDSFLFDLGGADVCEFEGLRFYSSERITPQMLIAAAHLDRRHNESLKSYLGRVTHISLAEKKGLGLTHVSNLHHCRNLRVLSLDGNNVSDLSGIDPVARTLERLYVQQNKLDSLSTMPSCMNNLLKLYLTENSINDLGEVVEKCPCLEELHVSGQLGGVELTPLAGLQCLRVLSCANNRIDDITPLFGLSCLEYLDVRNNLIEGIDTTFEVFASLRELESIALEGNPLVKKVSRYRDRLIMACPRLRHIDDEDVKDNTRQYLEQVSHRRAVAAAAKPPRRSSSSNNTSAAAAGVVFDAPHASVAHVGIAGGGANPPRLPRRSSGAKLFGGGAGFATNRNVAANSDGGGGISIQAHAIGRPK
eukprot:PhM_4_TR16232/c0_g1_i1/m.18814/K17579/PPP1R42, LRRC67; protein phosphatase 1 regulatory subunit 42